MVKRGILHFSLQYAINLWDAPCPCVAKRKPSFDGLLLPDQEEASACNEGTYKEATCMGLNEVACAFD
jgi:hypothetical protein